MNPEQSPFAEQAPAFDIARAPNLIFLGGIFLPEQTALIERNSRVNVQHAADALQKAVLRGLSQHTDVSATVVSLPFIASFPRRDRALWFPAVTGKLFDRIPVHGDRKSVV